MKAEIISILLSLRLRSGTGFSPFLFDPSAPLRVSGVEFANSPLRQAQGPGCKFYMFLTSTGSVRINPKSKIQNRKFLDCHLLTEKKIFS